MQKGRRSGLLLTATEDERRSRNGMRLTQTTNERLPWNGIARPPNAATKPTSLGGKTIPTKSERHHNVVEHR